MFFFLIVINFVGLVFHVATQVGDVVIVGVLGRYIVAFVGLTKGEIAILDLGKMLAKDGCRVDS